MISTEPLLDLTGASSSSQTVRYVCIHGHFYQPPRENPWLEAIEGQPSAYPYHDWNERITAECYAPNANARILDAENRIIAIVNNYAAMSFNFGPTLLSWLDEKEPEVYRAILAADAESRTRYSGHDSALAQPYNHMILPLASARDRKTQIAWGIADFHARFGREPEGMWLPEAAVDLDTLEALATAGIRFTILSPHQASHVRRIGEDEWRETAEGGPDPTVPYRVTLPSGASIAVFFYDGPISRAVAFDRLLSRGDHLAERLMGAFSADREGPQLVHIATDGETFGHHHRHGDMALAYALRTIESAGLAKVTNYGEFLEKVPPRSEARIREKTSWSCAHGVERWRSDCGCQTGAHPGWNQAWRAPLREALDALRDALAPVWEERAGALLADPWTARDAYIDVILDRTSERSRRFLEEHAKRELSEAERIEAWKLLEIQRHAQLMYTSCGWFFDDIGGIEARQILAYAGRALQLSKETLGRDFEPAVLEPLSRAVSNLPETRDGRRIYEESVRPAAVSLQDVGAHYGVHALFHEYPAVARVYCYRVAREELHEYTSGRARLQLGRAKVTSEITGESAPAAWGVLHLGDHNLSGGLLRSGEPDAFAKAEEELEALFRRADLPEILRAVDRSFGRGDRYALRLLFRDEQQQVLAEILRTVLDEADAVYRRLYEEHASLMRFLSSHGVPPPRGFRMAAEQALNTRLRRALEAPEPDVSRLQAILEDARNVGVTLHEDGLGRAFERTIGKMATDLRARPGDRERLLNLEGIVTLVKDLPFEVDFWKVQNAYYQMARTVLPARRREADAGFQDAREWVERFLALGAGLAVKVEDMSADSAPRV